MILPKPSGKEFEEWAADLVRLLETELNSLRQQLAELEARIVELENP